MVCSAILWMTSAWVMRACLFSRPSVLARVAPTPRGARAPAPATLPLGGLPAAAARLYLGRIEAALEALAGAQGGNEVFRREAQMHEVAEAAAVALAVLVLAAARLAEVGDGGELGVKWSAWRGIRSDGQG